MKALIKDNSRLFWVFLIGSLIRFGCEGFVYYPYLDDYVQYMFYPSLPVWDGVFAEGAKTIYTRPLAAVFDIFLWGKLGNNLFIAMIILAVLYGISGILFYCALNQSGIKLSPFFLVIYVFCPLNIEGTYWVSAASRISVSLFFVALGAAFLTEYLSYGKKKNLLLFSIFHFLSYWLYEQTAIISFLLCLWLLLRQKRFKEVIIPMLCGGLFIAWYMGLGRLGNNGARLERVAPSELFKNIGMALREIFYILTNVFGNIMKNGVLRGLWNMLSSPLWILEISLLTYLLIRETKEHKKGTAEGLFLGIVLFFGALAPFYITKNIWFNLRNFTPAGLGGAIILDFLVSKFSAKGFKCVLGAVLVLFMIVQSSEIIDYNKTARMDFEVAKVLKEEYEKTGNPHLVLKGELPEYLPQNAVYHDHIVTGAALDWGYTGMVRGRTKNPHIKVERQRKAQQQLQ